jgi:hypothetical protein
MQPIEIKKNPTIDYPDDFYTPTPVAIVNNDTPVTLISAYTKPGKKAFLTALGVNIDAAAQPYVTYNFLQNGVPLFPFVSQQNQFSDPTFIQPLPYRFPLNQATLYSLTAKVSTSGPSSSNAIGRFIIEYEDF